MRPSLPLVTLAKDVGVRTSSGAFVTVPKGTLVKYESALNAEGSHIVHRFHHMHRGECLTHITVCETGYPDWHP